MAHGVCATFYWKAMIPALDYNQMLWPRTQMAH